MKRITYILFTLLLSSCFYDAVYNFDKEDLAWMEPYDKRDTIIFASEEGMDTMIVDNKTLHDDHNALFVPNEATSVYNANGYIQNVVFHDKAHFECKLMIVKKNEKVMELYLLFKERALMFVDKHELQMTTIVVDGVEYDDAIIVDDSNSQPLHNALYYCDHFIWSKSKGLLEYKYRNGEVYTFYKKLQYKRKD